MIEQSIQGQVANVNAVVPGITVTPMIGELDHRMLKNGPLANLLGRISEASRRDSDDIAKTV
jgi:hypothetical protein